MRALLNILILVFLSSSLAFGQAKFSGATFNLLTDIKSQAGTDDIQVYLNGITSNTDNNGGSYRWDATSVASNDDFNIIQVTGVTTGRWIRSRNANYKTGSTTFSGVTLQSAYTVAHGLGLTPSAIFVQPKSLNAAALSYVSAIDGTNFTITFLSVPVIGSNNISFYWLAIK